MRRTLFTLLLILVPSATADYARTREAPEPLLGQQEATTATPEPRAVIYIFMKGSLTTQDASPKVSVDGNSVSSIYSGTYFSLAVRPGKHTVTAIIGRHTASEEFDIPVGDTYYLEVTPKFSHLELVTVSKEKALSAISKERAINPVQFKAPPSFSRSYIKAENKRLKATADEAANLPTPTPQNAATSEETSAAVPANSQGSKDANASSSSRDLKTPVSASNPTGMTLTDEQIRAAIQKGVDSAGDHLIRKPEWVRGSGGVRQLLTILSDSDRIAWVANSASHNVTGINREGIVVEQQKRPGFSHSIEDAKSLAVLLGVVTVIVEIAGPTESKIAEWAGPDYHIALEADGKLIEPLTEEDYIARVQLAHTGANMGHIEPWNYRNFMSVRCSDRSEPCIYKQVVFPVIEGPQKLSIVITNAKGQRREKQIAAKLFEEQ